MAWPVSNDCVACCRVALVRLGGVGRASEIARVAGFTPRRVRSVLAGLAVRGEVVLVASRPHLWRAA